MNLQEITEKLQYHFERLACKYPTNPDVGAIGASVLVELRNHLSVDTNKTAPTVSGEDIIAFAHWITGKNIFYEVGAWYDLDKKICDTDQELLDLYHKETRQFLFVAKPSIAPVLTRIKELEAEVEHCYKLLAGKDI